MSVHRDAFDFRITVTLVCMKFSASGFDSPLAVARSAPWSCAFNTEREGQINKADLFMLLRLDIEDDRWKRSMEAVRSSMTVSGSKEYVGFYERDSPKDQWRSNQNRFSFCVRLHMTVASTPSPSSRTRESVVQHSHVENWTPVADDRDSFVPVERSAFLAPTSPQLVAGLHQIKERGEHRLWVVDGIDGILREAIEPASKHLDCPLAKPGQSSLFDKFQPSRITDQFRHSHLSIRKYEWQMQNTLPLSLGTWKQPVFSIPIGALLGAQFFSQFAPIHWRMDNSRAWACAAMASED